MDALKITDGLCVIHKKSNQPKNQIRLDFVWAMLGTLNDDCAEYERHRLDVFPNI